jgi:hypothetical protein
MQTYEIRVLNDDLTTRVVFAQSYINDNAALRSARQFAEPYQFELWRGLTCVSGTVRFKAQPDFSQSRPLDALNV